MSAVSNNSKRRPDLRIAWDLSKRMRDVSNGEVDLAIRWALEPEGDLHWEPLLRTWFTPLMRPDVARYVECPSDIPKRDLIGVEFVLDQGREHSVWLSWFHINDLDVPAEFAIACTDTASAVETAIATGHVALAGSFLASAHLANGELIAPFDTENAPFSRFWLVCRKGFETTSEYLWFLSTVRKGAMEIDAQSEKIKLFHPDGSLVPT